MEKLQTISKATVLGKDFKIYGDFENPLFLAKDVAEMIEYSKTSMMLQSVDDDEKLKETIFTSGQNREVWFLTENGLYEVLMQSSKPIAKEFKKEVKKILHELRTNEIKIVSATTDREITLKEEQVKLDKSKILLALSENHKDDRYGQILEAHALKELTGEFILPLPESKKTTYSATEIGNILGISANKVGSITKANNLKTENYGEWVWDKKKYGSGEIQTFRYYKTIVPEIEKYI